MAGEGWEHFEHGADIGVRGFGPTKAAAFEQASLALTAVMSDPDTIRPLAEVSISCTAPDDELLLADWLNAVVHPTGAKGGYRFPLEMPAFSIKLLKGAPHPKAAQLFLNWIITKEGMQLYSDLEGAPTTRSDLDTSKLLIQESVPKPGVKYFDTAEWNYVMKEARKQFKKIKKMLGGGKSRKGKRRK